MELYLLALNSLLSLYEEAWCFVLVLWVAGWTKEVWNAGKLAERVHNGGHSDSAKERNGCTPQPETCSTSRRELFLAEPTFLVGKAQKKELECPYNVYYIVLLRLRSLWYGKRKKNPSVMRAGWSFQTRFLGVFLYDSFNFKDLKMW